TGTVGSPGVSAVLATESTLHEFMLRYDTANEVRRRFTGNNEYLINEQSVSDYAQGRYFLLPDIRPQNLRVWLEDADGSFGSETVHDEDGIVYRLLTADQDYGFRPELGELSLSSILPEGRVLVHYTLGRISVGDSSYVGQIPVVRLQASEHSKHSDYEISKNSVDFSLQQGGDFEQYFVIPLNELYGFTSAVPGITLDDFSRVLNKDRSGGQAGAQGGVDAGDVQALVLYEPGLFSPFEIQAYYTVDANIEDALLRKANGAYTAIPFRNTAGGVQLSPKNSVQRSADPWKIRYPLLDIDAETARLYVPGFLSNTEATLSDTLLQFRSKIGEGLRIEDKIVPGSLSVYQNSRFVDNVEIVDGLLIFPENIGPLDDILIVYRTPDQAGQFASLSAAIGNRFFLSQNDTLELALSGALSLPREGENSPSGPSHIQLSGAYHLDGQFLKAGIEGSLRYTVTDTNGIFQPLQAASDSSFLAINAASLFPSAAPETVRLENSCAGDCAAIISILPNLNPNNRGQQVFRNFRQNGIILPRDTFQNTAEPEELTTAIGPYPALPAENDSISGTLAALEFTITGDEPWVGYQSSNSSALSDFISGFTISVFPESLNGRVHVFLQAGELNEDIDGDLNLDSQARPEQQGIPFTGASGELLAAYPGQAYYEGWQGLTEDINGNGRLDGDNPAAMVSHYLGLLDASDVGSWQNLSYNLTAVESARLKELRSLRIILVSDGHSDGSTEGRIFFGDQKIRRKNVIVLGETARIDLNTDHYVFSWTGNSFSELRFPLASIPQDLYESLEIELNGKDLASQESITVAINGTQLAQLSVDSEDNWKTLRINFVEKNISLLHSGNIEYTTPFSHSLGKGELKYLSFTLMAQETGALLLRPPEFSDSREIFSGGGQARMQWTPESAVLFPDSVFHMGISSLDLSAAAFSPGFGAAAAGLDGSIQLTGYLPFFLSSIFLRYYSDLDDQIHIDSSHSLTFDAIQGLKFTNIYSQQWMEGKQSAGVSQNFGITLDPAPWFYLNLSYQISAIKDDRRRDWDIDFTLGENPALHTALLFSINEEKSAEEIFESSYMTNYFNSIALLDWTQLSSDDFRRNTDIDISIGFGGENFSGELGVNALSAFDSLPNLNENFTQTLQAGFYSDSGIDVIINGKQKFFHQSSSYSGNFFDPLELLFEHAAINPYVFLPLYIIGVFSDDAGGSFFSSAGNDSVFRDPRRTFQEYEMGIVFRRDLNPSMYDLIIPRSAELDIIRKLEWIQGIQSDARSLKALITWQALNLFGKFGREPIFSFYESDEFSMNFQYRQNLDNIEDWRIGGELMPVLFELQPFSELRNTVDWKFASRGEASFSLGISSSLLWMTRLNTATNMATSTGFENLNTENESLGFEHEEAISLRFTALRESSSATALSLSEKPGFSILLRHGSALFFSDLGKFNADIAVAYTAESVKFEDYAYAHSIGLEINLILEISY
ncbi:MAG: hypothetical protein ACR2PY_00460, partial [Salinispira sp.]